jgi:hypothetical protein
MSWGRILLIETKLLVVDCALLMLVDLHRKDATL